MDGKKELQPEKGKEEWKQYFSKNAAPQGYTTSLENIEKFCKDHASHHPIVLVTSGGTTVPLEHNTVRYVDNFSAGTRGAASTEYFLAKGYAVIFLHRDKSVAPFVRHLDAHHLLNALQKNAKGDLQLSSQYSSQVYPTWESFQEVMKEKRFLSVSFNTLSDYLWLLRASAECLQKLAPRALLYLAAAVSDFYIPQDEMSVHKIQSDSGPLTMSLEMVPKMLRPLVSIWGPDLYVASFKLETDPEKLIEKATVALKRYKHKLVIGNLLQTRREQVTLVTVEKRHEIKLTQQQQQEGVEIEKLIVNEVCDRHRKFMDS